MHESSHDTMRAFVRTHLAAARGRELHILDFGSQIVTGQSLSYTDLIDDPAWHYRGLDIAEGVNVDVVVGDAYDWGEIESNSIDLVISGQALEHVEYFWASMFEIVRILKPGGITAIIAPSSGFEHRYPVDCWRFYRDGFDALARYVQCDVVDAYTDWDHGDWADSILVAQKPAWSSADALRFDRRAALQRALLSSDTPSPDQLDLAAIADTSSAPSAISILSDVTPGALSLELDSMRAARLETEACHEAQAEADAVAAVEDRISDEADRLATERANGITPLRVYGKLRAAVARVAGTRGRSLYKRLRGRS